MTDANGRRAPDSQSPSDTVVVLPSAMTAGRLLELSPGPHPAGDDVAAAWALVRDIHADDGAAVLALAVAIGCLCRALTPPAPADDGRSDADAAGPDAAAADGEGRR